MKRIQIAYILCALLAGCSEDKLWPRSTFELDSGAVVQCRWIDETDCGLKLHDCTDGGVYTCQQNVIER